MKVDLVLHSAKSDRGNNTSGLDVVVPHSIWKQIRTNHTSVFLHVLLIRSGADATASGATKVSAYKSVISSADVQNGDALTGTVRMVKHDVIPRSFRQRYLLSDFGLVNVSQIEGKVYIKNLQHISTLTTIVIRITRVVCVQRRGRLCPAAR